MRFIMLFLVLSSFLSACAFVDNAKTTTFNEEVKLLKIDSYKDETLISVYSNEEFELLIPLREILRHTYIGDERDLADCCNYISYLLKNKSNNQKIKDSKFELGWFSSDKFKILDKELFESGDYLIYNNKTNKYIEKVVVRWESWYSGPLAASFELWVYIDNFVFYEFNMMS